jgi:formylglycine-generating enzyme required for sulfatase activity
LFCNECGTRNPDGSKFCSTCGLSFTSPGSGQPAIKIMLGPLPSLSVASPATELGLPFGHILAGRYKILNALGMGGMGRVYLSEDQALGIKVAIKILRETLSADPGSVTRLIAEAKHSIQLSHPNVVRVNHFENGELVKFLVMEYVEGQTLGRLIADKGKLPEAETRRIGMEICRGLEHAHEMRVIHRDIKPGNILVRRDGAIKIADFGIAGECRDSMSRLTSQVDSGTLLYMSPEQLMGKSNEVSDLYSLGVVLYEMLTGQPPFRSGDIAYQIRELVPDPPMGVAPELSGIVLKCLEKKPERRFPSVRALREELDGTAEAKRKEEARAADLRRIEEERSKQAEIEASWRKQAEIEANRRTEEERRREEEKKKAAAGLAAAALEFLNRGALDEAETKLQEALSLNPGLTEAKAALDRCRVEKRTAELRERQAQIPKPAPVVAKPRYGRNVAIGLFAVAMVVIIIWLVNSRKMGESKPASQNPTDVASIPQTPPIQSQPPAPEPEKKQLLQDSQTSAAELALKAELSFWESIKSSNDPVVFRDYIAKYPTGRFIEVARSNLRGMEISGLKRQIRDSMRARDWREAGIQIQNLLKVAPKDTEALSWRMQINRELENKQAAAEQKSAAKSYGIEFVSIPAGKFTMGCSQSDSQCYPQESPPHEVTISRSFELGKYEVTQAQWVKVMENNPSNFRGEDRLPVEQVSWNDAQAFIAKLNALNDGYRYRLPTEAEWEYAARAGTTGPQYGNLEGIAWYDSNSGSKTHLEGQKQANGFGLYDMLGNVWEWCQDWYDEKYYGGFPAVDPKGPSSGQYRVLRGGSWLDFAWSARVSNRIRFDPDNRYSNLGFRVCR